jgi:hypothetical protein
MMKNSEIKDINDQLRKIDSPIKIFRSKGSSENCSGKWDFKCERKIQGGFILSRYRDTNYGSYCDECILKTLERRLEKKREAIKSIEKTIPILKMHKDQIIDNNMVETI